MFSTWSPNVAVILVLITITPVVEAGSIDHDLTADGVSRTYSELIDAIPTAWDVLVNLTPLTEPSMLGDPTPLPRRFDAAENGSGGVLGHVVRVGHPNGAGRHVWGVYDRMAAIPSPMLLYFHDGRLPLDSPRPFDRAHRHRPFLPGAAAIRDTPTSTGGDAALRPVAVIESDPATTPVPEPTTIFIALSGLVGLLIRRRRQR